MGVQVTPKRRYVPSIDAVPTGSTRFLKVPQLMLMRRLRRWRFFPYIAVLGPGIVSAAAGNDAGGIFTYASNGATFGYSMLWVMLIITVSLVIVQEMCARMGAVTGKGLSDLIREQFGVGWTLLAVLVLFIANTGVTISDFVGIGAALGLLGLPTWLSVPPIALLIWWLVTKGSYRVVERVFMLLSLVFISYIIAAFMAKPNWGSVAGGLVHPTLNLDQAALAATVALIGTTITPYMQLFIQSSVVEKGVTPRDYKYTRFDTVFGSIFSNMVSIFIIVATAATLFMQKRQVSNAADAALALAPFAGQGATVLFAVGLFGASMLAAGVLPLATAYSVTESLGFEKGVSMSFREAPVFMWLFTALIFVGAIVASIPGLDVVGVLLIVQLLNGSLLPILLVFIVRLASNKELMGRYALGPVYKTLAWATVATITVAVVLMLYTTLFQ